MLWHFRLSVSQRVLCTKTAKHFVEILLQTFSTNILAFRHRGSLFYSDGFTRNGSTKYQEGEKIGRFLPISQCNSEMV